MSNELLIERPNLSDALATLQEAMATSVRVALPGRVTAYNSTTHLAEVQPLLQQRRVGEAQPRNLPVLTRVPVVHPRTEAAAVLMPVAEGDLVTLLFSDRALDRWKAGDGSITVEPESGRKHDLADCWAIPGGYPQGKPLAPINPGALEIRLTDGVKVAITNGTVELLTILHGLLDYLETTVTFSNGGGPTGPPTNASLLTTIREQLEQIKVT